MAVNINKVNQTLLMKLHSIPKTIQSKDTKNKIVTPFPKLPASMPQYKEGEQVRYKPVGGRCIEVFCLVCHCEFK